MSRAAPLPEQLQGRPFTVAEARLHGISRQRTRAADLAAPFHGVRTPARAPNLIALCSSYRLRMPEGHVFSHATAAALYGMPLPRSMEQSLTLHVSVPADDFPPQSRGIRGHSTALAESTRTIHGLSVVTPGVALLQLAIVLSHRELVRAGDFLVRRLEPLCDLGELVSLVDAAAGARGIRAFRRAVEAVRAGTDSPRETDTRLALLDAGLPEPVIGYRILNSRGALVATPDLAYPEQRVAIEYEGAVHREEEQFAYDIRRRELIEDERWAVVRVISEHLSTSRERANLANRVRKALLREQ